MTNLTIGSFELFYVLDISLKSFFFRAPYEKRLKATKIRKFFWKGTWSRFHPSHCKAFHHNMMMMMALSPHDAKKRKEKQPRLGEHASKQRNWSPNDHFSRHVRFFFLIILFFMGILKLFLYTYHSSSYIHTCLSTYIHYYHYYI